MIETVNEDGGVAKRVRPSGPLTPVVTVIMPARNVEAFVGAALDSVSAQTLAAHEVIVIDDGSTDGTAGVVAERARRDVRIRLLTGPGRGPGAARNLGLAQARGAWVAVVDADDEIAPGRLERLVSASEQHGAQLVADNLRAFYEDGRPEHPWLSGAEWNSARFIQLDQFLWSGIGGAATDQPGYLKPLFVRSWLEARRLTYDEGLMVGEDYDFVARALAAGARYRYLPSCEYRYRRHGASTSHRISEVQLRQMIAAFERLAPLVNAAARAALDARIADLILDVRFLQVVLAIKSLRLHRAAGALLVPGLRARLRRAAADGLRRRLGVGPRR